VQGGIGVGKGEPVADHKAVEPPFAAEDLLDQPVAVGAVHAVEPVVGRHDPEGPTLGDGDLEGKEVVLAQRPRVDDGVGHHPVVLGLVAGEVLDRADHTGRLRATDEGGTQPAGQQGVLGVGLEVSAAQWRTVEVDGGRQQDPARLGAGLLADHPAHALDEVRVEGRAQGGAAGHAGRGVRPVRAGHARECGAAGPVRTVGDTNRGDAHPPHRHRGPEVGTGQQRRLLVEVESGHQ